MSSPLLPYANALLFIEATGEVEVVGGRMTRGVSDTYIIQCYMVRQDTDGVTTGGEYSPTRQSPGDVLPGVSGETVLYRGYGLRWLPAPVGYVPGNELITTQPWTALGAEVLPDWLVVGCKGMHVQGRERPKYCKVDRVTGRYGGDGIDGVISNEIKGVPLVVRSGDVID
jgi:hypothetical protein